MSKCGAKTRSGHPCKNSAMANGRCRMHGGKATGAPKKNQNNRKHGIYSKYFTETEKQLINEFDLTKIDDELNLCKIRLLRALKLESEQGDELELTSKTVEPPIIGGIPLTGDDEIDDIVKETYQKRDYAPIIDKLIVRVQSLTALKAQLVSQSIDTELKQIELDKVKSSKADNEALPVKIVIDVKDARLNDKAEPEHASS